MIGSERPSHSGLVVNQLGFEGTVRVEMSRMLAGAEGGVPGQLGTNGSGTNLTALPHHAPTQAPFLPVRISRRARK